MKLGPIGMIVLYSLALVIPGGGAVVVGYHIAKTIREKRRSRRAQIQNTDEAREHQGKLQDSKGCDGVGDN
jgi:hypothetical protein